MCHKKTDLQCAGHMLIRGQENDFVELADRFRMDLGLKGEELVFESEMDCIEHHDYETE